MNKTISYLDKYPAANLAMIPMSSYEKILTNSSVGISSWSISPEKVSPEKVSPEKVSPARVSPARVSPARVSPEKVSPARVSPERVSPEKVSPEKVSPARVSPERVSPERVSPERVSPEKVSSATTYGSISSATVSPEKVSPEKVSSATVSPAIVSPKELRKQLEIDKKNKGKILYITIDEYSSFKDYIYNFTMSTEEVKLYNQIKSIKESCQQMEDDGVWSKEFVDQEPIGSGNIEVFCKKENGSKDCNFVVKWQSFEYFTDRFWKNEIWILYKLNGKNISPKIHDHWKGKCQDIAISVMYGYFVMDKLYVSLEKGVEDMTQIQKDDTYRKALDLAIRLGRERIIHGNITSSTIMFTDKTLNTLMLIDFAWSFDFSGIPNDVPVILPKHELPINFVQANLLELLETKLKIAYTIYGAESEIYIEDNIRYENKKKEIEKEQIKWLKNYFPSYDISGYSISTTASADLFGDYYSDSETAKSNSRKKLQHDVIKSASASIINGDIGPSFVSNILGTTKLTIKNYMNDKDQWKREKQVFMDKIFDVDTNSYIFDLNNFHNHFKKYMLNNFSDEYYIQLRQMLDIKTACRNLGENPIWTQKPIDPDALKVEGETGYIEIWCKEPEGCIYVVKIQEIESHDLNSSQFRSEVWAMLNAPPDVFPKIYDFFYGKCTRVGIHLYGYIVQEKMYRTWWQARMGDSTGEAESWSRDHWLRLYNKVLEKLDLLHSKRIVHFDLHKENAMILDSKGTDLRLIDPGYSFDFTGINDSVELYPITASLNGLHMGPQTFNVYKKWERLFVEYRFFPGSSEERTNKWEKLRDYEEEMYEEAKKKYEDKEWWYLVEEIKKDRL